MTKGNRVYRGQPCPRLRYPPRLTESKASSSALAGTRLASGKLSRDRKGDEKGRPARPQFDGLLVQAENENAVSRPFSPHPACFLLSTGSIAHTVSGENSAAFLCDPNCFGQCFMLIRGGEQMIHRAEQQGDIVGIIRKS